MADTTPAAKAAGVGCIALIVALAGAVTYACHADEAVQQATFDKGSAVTRSAVELAGDWADNQVAAAHDYGSKSLIISGIVLSISAGGDHPIVKLEGLGSLQPVSLILSKRADALPLRPTDEVTFACVGSRKSLSEVMVDSCTLLKRVAGENVQ